MNKRDSVRIELTTEQPQQIKDAFGSEIAALELDTRELEQRIAPAEPFVISKLIDKSSIILF